MRRDTRLIVVEWNCRRLAHYCDATADAVIESFAFVGCCISETHLAGIRQLNAEAQTGQHRPISTEVERRDWYDLIHVKWTDKASLKLRG